MTPVNPAGRQLEVQAAASTAALPRAAVAEVAAILGDDADLILAFVPDRYDPGATAEALVRWAGPRLAACSSAGGIGPGGFVPDGLVAVALRGVDLSVHTIPIAPLSDLPTASAIALAQLDSIVAALEDRPAFAVLLIDGLSKAEEEVTDALLRVLGDTIPLIGGSAGDSLRFDTTRVLVDGALVPDSATITLVATTAPFLPLRIQHHVAGDTVLVVTDATPEDRLVHTLNGRPAGRVYAEQLGIDVDRLGAHVFSQHPFVIRAGGAEWVRSISHAEPDGSLRLLCAAERGTVLRLGRATAPTAAIEQAFADARAELGGVSGALVFDCILRRLEFEAAGIAADVAQILAAHNAAGFSTFGEQFGGVHVNQTMVGIAFGG